MFAKMSFHLIFLFIFAAQHGTFVAAWENAEFEMFDLVEEVGKNFYEVLGVEQTATSKEIKQAYRKLSVKIHPDKSDAPDADVQFRQLVGIYEVLKDTDLRKSYDQVLIDGLPNWRQPIFYYRRVRKLAIWQVTIIVLAILSVGQYLAGWASYFEKKLAVQEMIDTKLKRSLRTRKAQKEGPKADEVAAEVEKYLQKPSAWDIAPVQICRFVKYMIVTFPFEIMAYYNEVKEEKARLEREAAEDAELLEQEALLAKEPKKPKKRKPVHIPEKKLEEEVEGPVSYTAESKPVVSETKKTIIKGGLWTDDDIAELSKLCHKFPGGTPERWEKIADQLCRPVPEVTYMAKKVLERLSTKPVEDDQVKPIRVKVKTKGNNLENDNDNVANWSAEEQKALEHALQLYPKGALDRWDKISSQVPGRTKEECTQRFKYLADLVKKKKEKVEEESQNALASNDNVIVEDVNKENVTSSVPTDSGTVVDKPAQSTDQKLEQHTKSKNAGKKVIIKEPIEGERSSSSSNSNSDSDWCVIDGPNPP